MRALLIAFLALLALPGCRETHHCEGNTSYQNGECLPRGDSGPRADTGLDGDTTQDAPAIDDVGDDTLGPCATCGDGSVCFDGLVDAGHGITQAPGCVECVSDTDCDTAVLPFPDGGGTDGGVGPGRPICDDYVCVRGCRADSECSGNACVANRCSSYPRSTQTQCERCDVEENCDATTDCVPMNFMGTAIGSYCLAPIPASGPCPARFTVPVAASMYCGVDQSLTTCDAVLDFSHGCSTASSCGRDDLAADGVCANVSGFGMACTYQCADDTTCPSSRTCGTSSHVCGGV